MDDIHAAVTPSGRKEFIQDLPREIEFKGSDECELGKPSENLKRLRTLMTDATRTQPDIKYLEYVANPLELTGAKTRPTRGDLTHRATMDATPLLAADIGLVLVHSCLTCWIERMHCWK